MFLRYLVSNWLQNQAQQVVQGTVEDYLAQATTTSETENSGEPITADIAVLMALGIEAGGFLDQLSDVTTIQGPGFKEHLGHLGEKRIALVETGVGQQAAKNATALIMKSRSPRLVISAGFAGGLIPELRKGHILLANEVVTAEDVCLPIKVNVSAEEIAKQKSLHQGRLITVNKIINEVAEKKRLAQQYQAVAVDMETAAVVQVCQQLQTQLISIRIITDGANDQLPAELERMIAQKKTSRMLGAAAAALLKDPTSIKQMWDLRDVALKASDRLGRFLIGTIDQF